MFCVTYRTSLLAECLLHSLTQVQLTVSVYRAVHWCCLKYSVHCDSSVCDLWHDELKDCSHLPSLTQVQLTVSIYRAVHWCCLKYSIHCDSSVSPWLLSFVTWWIKGLFTLASRHVHSFALVVILSFLLLVVLHFDCCICSCCCLVVLGNTTHPGFSD